MTAPAAAIVLAGGRSSRLGGVEKASVEIDGRTLVDHAFAAVRACAPVIAVGPDTIARPGIRVVREAPAFGGPAAAVAAGVAAIENSGVSEVWLLACDLPRAEALVSRLATAPIPADADAVVAVDAAGRMQWLAGRYRLAALLVAVDRHPDVAGMSMRSFFADLRLHAVDDGGTAVDLDTWAAVEDYRKHAKG